MSDIRYNKFSAECLVQSGNYYNRYPLGLLQLADDFESSSLDISDSRFHLDRISKSLIPYDFPYPESLLTGP